MMREKVKKLWKLCFNDSEEFTELYFRLRYNNDINIAIQSGEEVIASLQMLPYPMTFEGEDIHTAYISGACTHPDYRNRGVMHELLSQAFARMLHNNVALSTLIPAEPWLFDYYARSGYAPVFRYAEETFIASGIPAADTGLTLEMSAEYSEKRYEYLDRKLRERPCCIQHTKEDFQVYHCRFTTGAGLRLHFEQWEGNHGFGHYLSDRESQLAHWRNRVGYSRNKHFTASTYLPKPESPVHPGSHSSHYR